jgi:signal peptidase I
MRNLLAKLWDSWTAWIVVGIVFSNTVAQAMMVPTGSMKNTLTIGDLVVVKKYAYGLPIPRLPLLNTAMIPDLFGNGHLVEGKRPQRDDVVVFLYPKDERTNYVKRCVGVGGDELIYLDGHLLLHPHEGIAPLKEKFPQSPIVEVMGKKWFLDPYQSLHKGIGYRPERSTRIFGTLIGYMASGRTIAMKPLDLPQVHTPAYFLGKRRINALYYRVPKDHFFMVGDNRENSSDSRFWGAVPYRLIVGKPWGVAMSVEYRSYERMVGDRTHSSHQDHADLRRVCGDLPLRSQSCKETWNRHRFGVRWERVGRRLEALGG